MATLLSQTDHILRAYSCFLDIATIDPRNHFSLDIKKVSEKNLEWWFLQLSTSCPTLHQESVKITKAIKSPVKGLHQC